uniref:Glutenin, putative n=1 Tax=Theileria annulata TaxID=5874 RepID=A0A3B0N278_THEAN
MKSLIIYIYIIKVLVYCGRFAIFDVKGIYNTVQYILRKKSDNSLLCTILNVKKNNELYGVVSNDEILWIKQSKKEECQDVLVTKHQGKAKLAMLQIQHFKSFYTVKRLRYFLGIWVPVSKELYNKIDKIISWKFDYKESEISVELTEEFDTAGLMVNNFFINEENKTRLYPRPGFKITLVNYRNNELWSKNDYQEEAIQIEIVKTDSKIQRLYVRYETYYGTADTIYYKCYPELRRVDRKEYFMDDDDDDDDGDDDYLPDGIDRYKRIGTRDVDSSHGTQPGGSSQTGTTDQGTEDQDQRASSPVYYGVSELVPLPLGTRPATPLPSPSKLEAPTPIKHFPEGIIRCFHVETFSEIGLVPQKTAKQRDAAKQVTIRVGGTDDSQGQSEPTHYIPQHAEAVSQSTHYTPGQVTRHPTQPILRMPQQTAPRPTGRPRHAPPVSHGPTQPFPTTLIQPPPPRPSGMTPYNIIQGIGQQRFLTSQTDNRAEQGSRTGSTTSSSTPTNKDNSKKTTDDSDSDGSDLFDIQETDVVTEVPESDTHIDDFLNMITKTVTSSTTSVTTTSRQTGKASKAIVAITSSTPEPGAQFGDASGLSLFSSGELTRARESGGSGGMHAISDSTVSSTVFSWDYSNQNQFQEDIDIWQIPEVVTSDFSQEEIELASRSLTSSIESGRTGSSGDQTPTPGQTFPPVSMGDGRTPRYPSAPSVRPQFGVDSGLKNVIVRPSSLTGTPTVRGPLVRAPMFMPRDPETRSEYEEPPRKRPNTGQTVQPFPQPQPQPGQFQYQHPQAQQQQGQFGQGQQSQGQFSQGYYDHPQQTQHGTGQYGPTQQGPGYYGPTQPFQHQGQQGPTQQTQGYYGPTQPQQHQGQFTQGQYQTPQQQPPQNQYPQGQGNQGQGYFLSMLEEQDQFTSGQQQTQPQFPHSQDYYGPTQQPHVQPIQQTQPTQGYYGPNQQQTQPTQGYYGPNQQPQGQTSQNQGYFLSMLEDQNEYNSGQQSTQGQFGQGYDGTTQQQTQPGYPPQPQPQPYGPYQYNQQPQGQFGQGQFQPSQTQFSQGYYQPSQQTQQNLGQYGPSQGFQPQQGTGYYGPNQPFQPQQQQGQFTQGQGDQGQGYFLSMLQEQDPYNMGQQPPQGQFGQSQYQPNQPTQPNQGQYSQGYYGPNQPLQPQQSQLGQVQYQPPQQQPPQNQYHQGYYGPNQPQQNQGQQGQVPYSQAQPTQQPQGYYGPPQQQQTQGYYQPTQQQPTQGQFSQGYYGPNQNQPQGQFGQGQRQQPQTGYSQGYYQPGQNTGTPNTQTQNIGSTQQQGRYGDNPDGEDNQSSDEEDGDNFLVTEQTGKTTGGPNTGVGSTPPVQQRPVGSQQRPLIRAPIYRPPTTPVGPISQQPPVSGVGGKRRLQTAPTHYIPENARGDRTGLGPENSGRTRPTAHGNNYVPVYKRPRQSQGLDFPEEDPEYEDDNDDAESFILNVNSDVEETEDTERSRDKTEQPRPQVNPEQSSVVRSILRKSLLGQARGTQGDSASKTTPTGTRHSGGQSDGSQASGGGSGGADSRRPDSSQSSQFDGGYRSALQHVDSRDVRNDDDPNGEFRKEGFPLDVLELDDSTKHYTVLVDKLLKVPVVIIIPADESFVEEITLGSLMIWRSETVKCVRVRLVVSEGNFIAIELTLVTPRRKKFHLFFRYHDGYYKGVARPRFNEAIYEQATKIQNIKRLSKRIDKEIMEEEKAKKDDKGNKKAFSRWESATYRESDEAEDETEYENRRWDIQEIITRENGNHTNIIRGPKNITQRR